MVTNSLSVTFHCRPRPLTQVVAAPMRRRRVNPQNDKDRTSLLGKIYSTWLHLVFDLNEGRLQSYSYLMGTAADLNVTLAEDVEGRLQSYSYLMVTAADLNVTLAEEVDE